MKPEDREYAKQEFKKRNYDYFTQEKLMEYLEAHSELYGDIIPDRENIDRIIQNLRDGIYVQGEGERFLESSTLGATNPILNTIEVAKDQTADVFFHEIDHIATMKTSTFTKNYIILDSEIPEIKKMNINELCKLLDEVAAINMQNREKYGEEVNEGIEKVNGKGKNLNEGITQLKTKEYVTLRNLHSSVEAYTRYVKIAKQLEMIIGKKNLIAKHHNNDVKGIEEDVKRMTMGILDFQEIIALSDQIAAGEYSRKDLYEIDKTGAEKGYFSIKYGKKKMDEIKKPIIKDRKTSAALQKKLNKGFIASRCRTFGMHYHPRYYKKLEGKAQEQEIALMQEFDSYSISEDVHLMQTPMQKIKRTSEKIQYGIKSRIQQTIISDRNCNKIRRELMGKYLLFLSGKSDDGSEAERFRKKYHVDIETISTSNPTNEREEAKEKQAEEPER